MLFGSVTYSTIQNFLQAQIKPGWKVFGDVFTGPEAVFSWRNVTPSIDNVATTRLGWHVSSIKFGQMNFGVSGGWAHSNDLGSGYYGGVSFYGAF